VYRFHKQYETQDSNFDHKNDLPPLSLMDGLPSTLDMHLDTQADTLISLCVATPLKSLTRGRSAPLEWFLPSPYLHQYHQQQALTTAV